MKFRKKPVVIEAERFLYPPSPDEVQFPIPLTRTFCGREFCVCWTTESIPYISITTLEGEMRANIGDWIIKGVAGEFYPCKPDIFAATYEEVPK